MFHEPASAGASAPQPFPLKASVEHPCGLGFQERPEVPATGQRPWEAGSDTWVGMGNEGAAAREVQGVASAFQKAELPGHVSASALATEPFPRAWGQGLGKDAEHRPAAGLAAHTRWLTAHVAAEPCDSARAGVKLTPSSRDPTAPWHPSAPSTSPRRLPKHSLYQGVPAQHTISAPLLWNEGPVSTTRGPLDAANV